MEPVNRKRDLNTIFNNASSEIRSLWREIELDSKYPEFLIVLSDYFYLNSDLNKIFKDIDLKKRMYDVSLKSDNLEIYSKNLIVFFKKILDGVSTISLENFNGKNLIFDKNGYKVFIIKSFDEIEGFDRTNAICSSVRYFYMYSSRAKI